MNAYEYTANNEIKRIRRKAYVWMAIALVIGFLVGLNWPAIATNMECGGALERNDYAAIQNYCK